MIKYRLLGVKDNPILPAKQFVKWGIGSIELLYFRMDHTSILIISRSSDQ